MRRNGRRHVRQPRARRRWIGVREWFKALPMRHVDWKDIERGQAFFCDIIWYRDANRRNM